MKGSSLVAQMVKNLLAMQEHGFNPWVWKIPRRREWQPTSEFLPGEFHGLRNLAPYSPGGHKESYMPEATEHACRCLHTKRRHLHIFRQKEYSFISWVMDGLSYQEIKILPLPYFNRYWKSGVFHLISYLFHHVSNKLWLVY